MASVSLFVVFVLSHLVLLHSAEGEGKQEYPTCWSPPCGEIDVLYPFTRLPPPFCGLLQVKCDRDGKHPTINLPTADWETEKPYEVKDINYTTQQIRVKGPSFSEDPDTNNCNYLDKFALPNSPLISFKCIHIDEPNLSAEFALEWHVSGKGGLCNPVLMRTHVHS